MSALVCAGPAMQAQKKAVENWDLIDFDRVTLPAEESSYPVSYTIMHETDMMVEIPLRFGGELVKVRDIDLSDKKQAVRKALDDRGWSFVTLAQYLSTVGKYKDINYSQEEFYDDVMTMAGANASIAAALGLITGVKDSEAYFFGEDAPENVLNNSMGVINDIGLDAVGEIADANAMERLLQTIKGIKILNFITDAYEKFEVFMKARERDKQKWANRVAEMNMKEIAAFYDLTCKYLQRIARDKDHSWVLRVHGAANSPFYYESVMCTQHWSIDMELNKNPFGANEMQSHSQFTGSYEGEYIGWMDAEVVYSMANWDARYFVDKQLRNAAENQTLGSLMMMSAPDHRTIQSMLKAVAEENGLTFRHDTKPTQAHNIYRLPVRVILKSPSEDQKYLSPSMEILMGDKEWMPGDKPQPEITKSFQLVHNVSVTGRKDGAVFDYMANYYATEDELVFEHSDNVDLVDAHLGAVASLSAHQGQVEREAEPLSKEGFNGKPDGFLEIYLDQSRTP